MITAVGVGGFRRISYMSCWFRRRSVSLFRVLPVSGEVIDLHRIQHIYSRPHRHVCSVNIQFPSSHCVHVDFVPATHRLAQNLPTHPSPPLEFDIHNPEYKIKRGRQQRHDVHPSHQPIPPTHPSSHLNHPSIPTRPPRPPCPSGAHTHRARSPDLQQGCQGWDGCPPRSLPSRAVRSCVRAVPWLRVFVCFVSLCP